MRDKEKVLLEFYRVMDSIKTYEDYRSSGIGEELGFDLHSTMHTVLKTLAWVLEYEGEDSLLRVYGRQENVVF